MIEYIPLCSNAVVVGLLWYSIRRSGRQEKELNQHIVNFTEKITERPNFDQMDTRIEKATKPICKKVENLSNDFRQHHHDNDHGSVILRT